MLITPMLLPIATFDADRGIKAYFTFTSSAQSIENNLVIKDTSNGAIVYDFNLKIFEKAHDIPPAVLENGKTYEAKVRVKYVSGEHTEFSNTVRFNTVKTPILDIDSIDGQGYVYNSDVTFVAIYSQRDNEAVKWYRFTLLDENENLINEYPTRYVRENGLTELTETVKGLEKGKAYFIKCQIETERGLLYHRRERFIPLYINPSANGVVSTVLDEEEGFVRITANLKQIVGSQVKGYSKMALARKSQGLDTLGYDDYEYIDNEWIVVPKNKPVVFKNLGMNRASDFVMKLWAKNIPNNTVFATLTPVDGIGIGITFIKRSDRIVAIKENGILHSTHVSNIIEMPNDAEFLIYARIIEHRIELSVSML